MTAKRAFKHTPRPTTCDAYVISGKLQPHDEQVITELFNDMVGGNIPVTFYTGPKTSSDPEQQELYDQEFNDQAHIAVRALGFNRVCGKLDHVTVWSTGFSDYVAVVQQPGSYLGYSVVVLCYRY